MFWKEEEKEHVCYLLEVQIGLSEVMSWNELEPEKEKVWRNWKR